MPTVPPKWRKILLAVAAVLAAATGLIHAIDSLTGDSPPPSEPVTVLGGPGRATVPVAPASAVASTAAGLGDHAGARDETPEKVPAAQIEAGREQQDDLAATDQLPLVTPNAAPEQAGCTTRLVRNYSSRRGVRPRELVAHYTVSRNRPGWSDVWAIVGLFDQASFAASSNYVIDAEGNCAYIVRESDKAWTQAAFNPLAISIEFVAMGNEGGLSKQQVAKGARVFADAARRWNIPIRRGTVTGCTASAPGIVDHATLGACGGGHHDIKPFSLQPLIDATRSAAGGTVTAADKVTCRKLNWWRAHGRPKGLAEQRAVHRRRALAARDVVCTATGPVRA